MSLHSVSHASIPKRVLGGIIDYVVLAPFLVTFVFVFFYGDIDGWVDFYKRPLSGAFPFVMVLVFSIFPLGLRDVIGGKGLGKWILGMRVVDAANPTRAPSVTHLLLRNLTNPISPVGLASAMHDPEKARFGDRLANTLVVDDPPDPNSLALLRRVVKGVVLVALLFGGLHVLQKGVFWWFEKSEPCRLAVDHLRDYGPLTTALGGVDADDLKLRTPVWKISLRPQGVGKEGDDAWIAASSMEFIYMGDNAAGLMGVSLIRGVDYHPDWMVGDLGGYVEFYTPKGGLDRMFVFSKQALVGRFLTPEEIEALQKREKTIEDIFPKLKAARKRWGRPATPSADNATIPAPPSADKAVENTSP